MRKAAEMGPWQSSGEKSRKILKGKARVKALKFEDLSLEKFFLFFLLGMGVLMLGLENSFARGFDDAFGEMEKKESGARARIKEVCGSSLGFVTSREMETLRNGKRVTVKAGGVVCQKDAQALAKKRKKAKSVSGGRGDTLSAKEEENIKKSLSKHFSQEGVSDLVEAKCGSSQGKMMDITVGGEFIKKDIVCSSSGNFKKSLQSQLRCLEKDVFACERYEKHLKECLSSSGESIAHCRKISTYKATRLIDPSVKKACSEHFKDIICYDFGISYAKCTEREGKDIETCINESMGLAKDLDFALSQYGEVGMKKMKKCRKNLGKSSSGFSKACRKQVKQAMNSSQENDDCRENLLGRDSGYCGDELYFRERGRRGGSIVNIPRALSEKNLKGEGMKNSYINTPSIRNLGESMAR